MNKNKKIKIVGIFLCLLIITTISPTVGTANSVRRQKNTTIDSSADLFDNSVLISTGNESGIDFEIDIQAGHGVNVVITNKGESTINSIPWCLSMNGGFLGYISKKIDGFLDLSAGGSVTIKVGIFFGLGPISITIKMADEEYSVTGTQILAFTLLKKSPSNIPMKNIMINKSATSPLNSTNVDSTKNIKGNDTVVSPPRKPSPVNPTYYRLTITCVGNGSVTPSSYDTYLKGTKVDVIATPAAGWEFAGWSGDISRSTAKVTMVMNTDLTITAHFIKSTSKTYTLTINAGAGGTTTPAGVHTYSSGTTIECFATPKSGFHFTGWSGEYTGTNNPYRIVMKANYQLTANFEANLPNYYTLTTTVVGTGCSVTKNPNQASYLNGTVVTLTAVPVVGWTFSSWSGAISGTSKSVMLTMTGNKAVTATFTQNTYTLTMTVASGIGTLTKTPNYTTYTHGTVVSLTANPGVEYTFGGWGGDATGSTSSTTVTMTGNKAVSAMFLKQPAAEAKHVKKFMIAYFTPTVVQQQYIAEHIDLLDLRGDQAAYDTIAPMKAVNPALKVITYRELNGVYGPPSAHVQDDWTEVNSHENWFLHSLSGSRLITAGTTYHYNMNPNPAVGWNQHHATIINQHLVTHPLLDGVFLDNAGRFWGTLGDSGNILDQDGDHLYLSDIAQTIQTMYPFSGSVGTGDWVYSAIDTIIDTNPSKLIMGNSGASWDLVNNLGMWLCIEGFSDDKHWSTQDYQLSAMNAFDAGITYNTNIGVICSHSLAPTYANREAIRFWAISCYSFFCLVLKDPAKSYFCFQSSYGNPYPADAGYWFSEFDTPLGEPLGPKQLIAGNTNDGVYMRRFENATILRNLSMGGGLGTQRTYTVTVDGIHYTLEPEEGAIIIT